MAKRLEKALSHQDFADFPQADLALLGLSPEHLRGGRALPEEQPQRVLLQTHVPDGPRRLPRLLPRVHEHQHLGDRG